MPRSTLDFDRIARAALDSAERLLPVWLPQGHREGPEWRVGGLDGSAGQSLAINLRTGVWCDFAGDERDRGSDLISLYAAVHGLSQGDAAREVAESLHMDVPAKRSPKGAKAARVPAKKAPDPLKASQEGEGPSPPAGGSGPTGEAGGGGGSPPADAPGGGGGGDGERRSPWRPIVPVPEGAPEAPRAHPVRRFPSATWEYRDAESRLLGYVYRFTTSDGGKEVLPLTFCEHVKTQKREWRWMSFPEPRPLYGLPRLRPGKPVLVVEGEKCADAGWALPEVREAFDVVSWPGGGKASARANWGTLAGRSVLIWPDCDAKRDKRSNEVLPEAKQPGIRTAESIATELAARGCKVRLVKIPAPGEKPDGWDIADAVAEGMAGAQVLEWLRGRQRAPAAEAPEPPGKAPHFAPEDWRSKLIYKKGDLANCTANVFDILRYSPEWAGVVAWDEFSQRTVKLKPPPFEGGTVGEWDSVDDTQTAMWIARQFQATPSSVLVTETVEVLARRHAFHPVRDWLRSLQWDGLPRADHWLVDCLGVPDTDYARLVGRWFLMGMVARVMRPGVKFDYCLVLEGPQGEGKSTMLRLLAGEWFGDQDLDLSHKDAMSALRGKWLWEFPELGSLARAEERRQKSFLSRQVDEFRPVYGRREIALPRQLAFSGTTNEWEWNKDPTGGRRFWPVMVGALNFDRLREAREQLFAEALHLYLAGGVFWPDRQQQREIFDPEQLRREQPEGLVDALHDWVYGRTSAFSMASAVMDGLKLDAGKMTRDLQTRVGIALRKLGCSRVERRNGTTRYWYEPPEKSARSSASSDDATYPAPGAPQAGADLGGDDAIPF